MVVRHNSFDLAMAIMVSALISFTTGILLAIVAGGVLLWLL